MAATSIEDPIYTHFYTVLCVVIPHLGQGDIICDV